MFLGMRTVTYRTPDLAAGKAWYASVLGHDPHFDEPYYVGFNVAGYELGLMPDGDGGAGGTTFFWGVDEVETAVERLTNLGATLTQAATDVGGGIRVATVTDPFGNVLGVIENPNFVAAKAG